MANLVQLFSLMLILIAVVAVITSVIVQVTKDTKLLDKIPSELEVIVVSVILTIVFFLAFCDYKHIAVLWYYIVGMLILGIISAFVCMHGWEKLITIIYKFKVPKEVRDIYKNISSGDDGELSDTEEDTD